MNILDYLDHNVTLRFGRNDVIAFQNGSMELRCKLIHVPNDTGDHWHFEYDGIVFTLNPLTPDFVSVTFD